MNACTLPPAYEPHNGHDESWWVSTCPACNPPCLSGETETKEEAEAIDGGGNMITYYGSEWADTIDSEFWFTGPGWYFPDEADFLHGPYETEEVAEAKQAEYVRYML